MGAANRFWLHLFIVVSVAAAAVRSDDDDTCVYNVYVRTGSIFKGGTDSIRGKKDAATALFNLCIYQGNKGKAVRAGIVPTLMRLLTEPQGGMVDEALAILAILSSHPEGKAAIGAAEALPVLVEVIRNGSARNKENAAAVLVHLCSGDQQYMIEAQELGVMGPLVDLSQNGTERAKRKAAQLLERMNRFVEQQKLAQAQAEAQNQQSRPPASANAVDS